MLRHDYALSFLRQLHSVEIYPYSLVVTSVLSAYSSMHMRMNHAINSSGPDSSSQGKSSDSEFVPGIRIYIPTVSLECEFKHVFQRWFEARLLLLGLYIERESSHNHFHSNCY